jgi:hypothetical protein
LAGGGGCSRAIAFAADLDAAIVKAALAKGWTERRAGTRC